jgi:chromosome segregation ATPase
MKKFIFLLLIGSACVPAKKYTALQNQLHQKDVELTEAKSTILTLSKQLEDVQEEKKALTQDLRKLTSSSKSSKDKDEQIRALEQKIKSLEAKIVSLERNQASNNNNKNQKDTKTKKPKSAY